MKSMVPFLALLLPISGCDRQSGDAPSTLEFAQGAIQVRQLESTDSDELLFEIDLSSTGELTVATGPSGMSMMLPIRATPDRRVLRVVREEVEGDTILDRFVRPLYGEGAAQLLRDRDPEATGRKLLLTTLIIEGGGGSATIGPSATVIPWPEGGSTSAGFQSGAIDEPRARLAAWLYLPDMAGVRQRAAGIAPDGPRIELDGKNVTVEQAGAVFTELTLEFATEVIALASNGRP